MEQPKGAAVVIIGGGVTGLSAGWWLARSGVDVLVLEKGIVGWEASGRNGGGATHVYSPFGLEEQRLWPQMDELLGYPTEHQPYRIGIALSEAQLALARRWAEIGETRGFRWELLDRQQLKELVPIVGDNAIGGTYLHFGGHANPQRTVQAYAWALQDHGGRILQHTTVTGLTRARRPRHRRRDDAGHVRRRHRDRRGGPADRTLRGHARRLAAAGACPRRDDRHGALPAHARTAGWRAMASTAGRPCAATSSTAAGLTSGSTCPTWRRPIIPTRPLVRNLARRLAELLPGAAHLAGDPRPGAASSRTRPTGFPSSIASRLPTTWWSPPCRASASASRPRLGKAISELVIHGRCLFADLSALALSRFADTPPDWRERVGWISAAPVPRSRPEATR